MQTRAFLFPLALLTLPALLGAQSIVDHTAWQTQLRNQGNRNTCITFAAVAAVEARYKRQGLVLDLSEEFAVSMEKMNWLHANWSQLPTADTRENQLIGTGGGSGAGYIFELEHWMRLPVESAMPYRIGPTAHQLPYPWNDPYWQSQRNVNTWNLDTANLPRAALNQANYYSVTSQVQLTGAQSRSAAAIESILQAGYEVVWDFAVHPNTPYPPSGAIWHAPSYGASGAHSMLIVGYNRSSANPANHHFIVKNSWGATSNPGGFTYVGYDYLASQGYGGAYITAVATPGPWPELKFLGRRNLRFDGWAGTLDIYHLPNTFEEAWQQFASLTMDDRRIGTFYDTAGVAHRVNGYIIGNELTCWWKSSLPNMRWDELRDTPPLGRMFRLRIVDGDGDELAGIHWDNSGLTPNPAHGDYARRPSTINGTDGYLQPVFNGAQPSSPEQWLGRWRLQCANRSAEVVVAQRNDSLVPASQVGTHAGLQCWLRENNGTWLSFVATTPLASPRSLLLTFPSAFLNGSLTAYMLTWQRGVAAGHASLSPGLQAGYLVRLGEHDFGTVTSFGTGCGALGSVPAHNVLGTPELGQTITFRVGQATPNLPAVLAMGLSNTSSGGSPLPVSLTALGAPGCWLRVDPLVTYAGIADAGGWLSLTQNFTNPALLGVRVYSQYACLRPGYNALGLVFSNGINTLLGGSH